MEETNGFIGRSACTKNIYTAGHNRRDAFTLTKVLDALVTGHPSDLLHHGDVRIVKFADGQIEAVKFEKVRGKDMAISGDRQQYLIRDEGIMVGGDPNVGDDVSVIGYHNGLEFHVPSEVVGHSDETNRIRIKPRHRDEEYFGGFSGASIVADPNGEYRGIGVFSGVDSNSALMMLGADSQLGEFEVIPRSK